MKYIEDTGRGVKQNKESWSYFKDQWTGHLKLRGILDGISEPTLPENYGISEQDEFYTSLSFSGTWGASGHDAPMIA